MARGQGQTTGGSGRASLSSGLLTAAALVAALAACGAELRTLGVLKSEVRYFSEGVTSSQVLQGSVIAGSVRIEVATTHSLAEVAFRIEALAGDDPLKVDDEAPFDLDLDSTELADGPHLLLVEATIDRDGEPRRVSVTVDFAVDNSEPEPPGPPGPPEPPDPPYPPEPPDPPQPATSCLETGTGPLVQVDGAHTTPYQLRDLAQGARVDAGGATFLMPYPGSSHPDDPFTVRDSPYVCVSGGVYSPGIPDDEPDWELYHHSQGVYLIDSVGPIVENVAIFESGDGVRFKEGTQDWTFRDSYVQHNGDDTIENDQLYSGVVDDILVDWAFVFLSCRLDTADRGAGYPPGGTVVVRDSLVALRPQVGAYKATNEGGRFFKWEKHDTPGCLLELTNNVFLVEDGEYASLYLDPSDDPDIDYETLVHSAGNVIVWLGEGDYPAPIPAGFTLSRDIGVWEAARDAWFERHPGFEQFR